jgi:hypothetical protein
MHSQALANPAPTEGFQASGEAEGLPQSKHLARLKPLTWAFAPLAGLEPATYGLEVDPQVSTPCCGVPSSRLRSGGLSS